MVATLMIVVAAGAAAPAGAENVLRWASATEALTFDPHAANHVPTIDETSQVYEPLVDFNSSYEIEPGTASGPGAPIPAGRDAKAATAH